MKKGLKIGLIIFTVVILGLMILCVWGTRWSTSSLPQKSGEQVVEGLQSQVHVYRDDYHIPHIIAQNEYDLFFAQGYITAQDRFWQMDLWRRMAGGNVSEILGSTFIKTDSLMLIVGIRRTARKIVPELSPESRRVFQAYTDGVNRYIQNYWNRLPMEFRILNYKPSPWTVEDCVTILRWIGWQFGSGWFSDCTMGAIVDQVGIQKAMELFPLPYQNSSPVVPWKGISFADLFHELRLLNKGNPFQACYNGSSGWVVSGNRSVTGKPLLANGICFAYFNPSVLYEIHLTGGRLNVSGVSYPGLPMIIAGHNDRIAWGITNLTADCQDLFIERMDSFDTAQVLYNGRYKKMEIIEEEILLRNQSSIPIRITKTGHGPVMTNVFPQRNGTRASVSLRWTGYDVSDEGLSLYRLNCASDWESFREALRGFHVPALHVIYADVDGNIGYQAAGKIPVRKNGIDFLPRSGADPSDDWIGFISYDDLLSVKNPKEGFIAITDHVITDRVHPDIKADSRDYSQIQRIGQLLSEKDIHSIMDFKRIQSDVFSPYALEILALTIPELKAQYSDETADREWIEKLDMWDGEMKTGSAEAAFFEVFTLQLIKNLFCDEMGDSLYASYILLCSLPLQTLSQLLKELNSPWFDHVGTVEFAERKRDIVIQSYKESVLFMKDQLGENMSSWSWGALHTVYFQHPLGGHPLLGNGFNLGPFSVGGSGATIDRKGYDYNHPFAVIQGSAVRFIMDTSVWDHSVSALPTGQSGQPLDNHYKDQLQLYFGNLYHSNLYDTTKIINSGWDHLALIPGGLNE